MTDPIDPHEAPTAEAPAAEEAATELPDASGADETVADAPPPEPREELAWCRANAAHGDALPRLNALRDELLRADLADDVVATAEMVMRPLFDDPAPRPLVQAHVMILFATLLQIPRHSGRIDTLFAAWMRHPSSYGSGRATPPMFQRAEFVQRTADLIGWGTVDVVNDREPLTRFFAWVHSWAPKQKESVRRTIYALRRNFPAPELWRDVRF